MDKKPTPNILLAVIRAHCLECSGGSRKQVHNCKITQCRLWPYRKGEKKPQKRKGREESAYRQITVFDLMEELYDKD